MAKVTTEERDAAREELRELLPVGAEVTCIGLHVARSGMSHDIALVAPGTFGLRNISPLAAKACGFRRVERGRHFALRVQGGGMDMGFHLVYSLSQTLHGDGYALAQRWLA